MSVEGVGIAAMEALQSGLPTIISNKSSTDFQDIKSLIDLSTFENKIYLKSNSEFLDYISEIKNAARSEKEMLKCRFGIDNYLHSLISFIQLAYNKKKDN